MSSERDIAETAGDGGEVPSAPSAPHSRSPHSQEWHEVARRFVSVTCLLSVILLSGWVSVDVIARIPLLQEGISARSTSLSVESFRSELELVRSNLMLPEDDTSPFSRTHPLQPLVNLLAAQGVIVSVDADSTVPPWLLGYVRATEPTELSSSKSRADLERLGELLSLPMSARSDLYRTLQRARTDAEFVKKMFLERFVQHYRAAIANSELADDARAYFNGYATYYHSDAVRVNQLYAECAAAIAEYDGFLGDVAVVFSDPASVPPDLSRLTPPATIYTKCSRSGMENIRGVEPESGSGYGGYSDATSTDSHGSRALGWGIVRYLVGHNVARLDLVLIVGMLGLGVLGASASQLIRAEEGERVAALASTDMVGIMVRGVTATLVVYLGVSCGLIVFTTGSAEANPYALLLGCFIAAVFSENVWAWARKLVGERLS